MQGDWAVVDVKGEVDLYTAPKLRERITELVEQGHLRIVVNLDEVSFLDSTGLGILVGALMRLRERNGALPLVCPEGPVYRVLEITGLEGVFPCYRSVDEAIGA